MRRGAGLQAALGLVGALGLVACGSSSPAPSAESRRTAQLDAIYAEARRGSNLTSLVISRDGVIQREEYFNGSGPDTPHNAFSVTKSVLALTVGAALDRGCLQSLDQTLGELLGPMAPSDPQKAAITLGNLLTMTSGLDYPEVASYLNGTGLSTQWARAPDQVEWILTRPLTAPPGQRFEYGTATIHLVSVALTRACGSGTAQFARDALFVPLGIPEREWGTDRQGYNFGGSGLELSARDLQALGLLVLHAGRVQGQQVIPADWVQAMVSTQVTTGPGQTTPAYGYGWWIGQSAGLEYALAAGWGGQFIAVVPSRGLVVTAASTVSGLTTLRSMSQFQWIFNIVINGIVPEYL